MGKPLPPDQLDAYERQGVLFPIPVLADSEVAEYRSALEEVEAIHGGELKRLDQAHLFFPWAYRLATQGAVLDAVASVIGDDLLIDGTLILCKYPRDPSYVSWHQDSVYSKWHLSPAVSAWIALSASNARSGCMRAVPGSHTRGLLVHDVISDQENLLRRGERVGETVDEAEAVDLELRPGEMSLHHCNIIHGSNPNRSDDKRIGFIIRFVTSRVGRKATPLVRARGTADDQHLDLVRPLTQADPAKALAAWREFTKENVPVTQGADGR